MLITQDQLKAIAHYITPANVELYTPLLNKYMEQYSINTRARLCPFLANLTHESIHFSDTLENATGEAYEGRIQGLGNTQPGDGVRFKGRGLIQITGRSMYYACSYGLYKDNRLLARPELLQQPDAATASACWFWTVAKGLNVIADFPDTYTHVFRGVVVSKFKWIVIKINGGLNGYADRFLYLRRAEAVIK